MSLDPLLKQNGGIAVVIGRKKDFPSDLQNHPQVIFWDQDKESTATKELPANCRFLFCSRFCSHKVSLNAIKQVKQRANCTFFGMEWSRAISEKLRQLLDLNKLEENKLDENKVKEPASEPTKPTEPTKPLRAPKYGELKSIISAHFDPNLSSRQMFMTIKPIVREHGLASSDASIKQAIASFANAERSKLAKQPTKPDSASLPQIKPVTSSLQHLDEAITYLQLVREEVAQELASCNAIIEMIRKIQIK